MDAMIHDVNVQQEIRLSEQDMEDLRSARFMLANSSLKDKTIAGRFICFDQSVPGNRQIVMLDEKFEHIVLLETEHVAAILDGWVISD